MPSGEVVASGVTLSDSLIVGSACVTGLATFVLAVFSAATVKLYLLEARRESHKQQQLAVGIDHAISIMAFYRTLLERERSGQWVVPGKRVSSPEELRKRMGLVSRRIGDLMEIASRHPGVVLAHLQAADIMLSSAEAATYDLEGWPESDGCFYELHERMSKAEVALRNAIKAMPKSIRQPEKGKELPDLFGDALEELKEKRSTVPRPDNWPGAWRCPEFGD